MDPGITSALVKKQVNLVGQDSREIVDVRFPVAVKGGGKDDPAIVIEDHEAQIMDCSYAIRVLLAFASESIGQQLAHAFRASWLERTYKRELVRLSCLCARPGLGSFLDFLCSGHWLSPFCFGKADCPFVSHNLLSVLHRCTPSCTANHCNARRPGMKQDSPPRTATNWGIPCSPRPT